MSCDHAMELLPWLLNGTLSASEALEVTTHLAECEHCRQELQETRAAAEVLGWHVPSEELVASVLDRASLSTSRQVLIETHLQACARCRSELALIKESEAAMLQDEAPADEDAVQHGAAEHGQLRWGRGSRLWRPLAAAASLAVLLISGGWLHTWQSLQTATLRVAQLERTLAQDDAARANVAVIDLLPYDLVVRGDEPDRKATVIPRQTPNATLILQSDLLAPDEELSLQVIDGDGKVIWRLAGLRQRENLDFTLGLPVDRLAAGTYELRLVGDRKGREIRLETYRLQIE